MNRSIVLNKVVVDERKESERGSVRACIVLYRIKKGWRKRVADSIVMIFRIVAHNQLLLLKSCASHPTHQLSFISIHTPVVNRLVRLETISKHRTLGQPSLSSTLGTVLRATRDQQNRSLVKGGRLKNYDYFANWSNTSSYYWFFIPVQ